VSGKRCYGRPPAGVDPGGLRGALIVVEGPDASGRSTQIALLGEWLEERGYAVEQVGLKRSRLVAPTLDRAQEGNVLSPRTMTLFYATDFYDQLENRIVPALRGGYVVLADRYIYTLMARATVRGADPEWLRTLYSMALVPDAVVFLRVSAARLVERTLKARASLDYWESGMDLGLARSWYDSFVIYQRRIRAVYAELQREYGFEVVNGNRSVAAIQRDLRTRVCAVLADLFEGMDEGGGPDASG